MFSHRGLFLAVMTISLASISLANVLVQPGYKHQYDSNRRYLQDQSAPQYWTQSPIEQYRAEQLPNQESTQYRPGVQTVYPYESNQADARSHVLSYPHRPPYHHYLPRSHHVHFARIGGHGYVRPSVYGYVGHPQSLMVHNRRKRSDPASTESSKSEVVAHDNDVAAKSPSTDAKHSTTIDSLLPEHELTDTTDKRVENRQIRNDYITNPRLFGLYNVPNTWQSMINQYYTINTVKETPNWFRELHTLLNKPQYIRPLPQEIINMNMISMAEPSHQDKTLQRPFYSEMTPKPYQYADTAATPTSVESQPPFVTYVQNPYRSNEQLSATNEIVGAPYDTNDRPCPNYNFNNLYYYPNDWDDGERLEDYFIGFKAEPEGNITNIYKAPVYNAPVHYNALVFNNPTYNASTVYSAPICQGLLCFLYPK